MFYHVTLEFDDEDAANEFIDFIEKEESFVYSDGSDLGESTTAVVQFVGMTEQATSVIEVDDKEVEDDNEEVAVNAGSSS